VRDVDLGNEEARLARGDEGNNLVGNDRLPDDLDPDAPQHRLDGVEPEGMLIEEKSLPQT